VPTDEDPNQLDDRALMSAVREGSVESFAHLYHRHAAVATAYARRLVRQSADEDDVVADAFLRVLGILSRGRGPQESFRPYLLRAVRNAAYDRTRAERRLELTGEVTVLEGAEPFRDTAVERFDRELVARAFRELPVRWQKVLWLTLIDELPVDVAAARLSINPNSLTSLAYRAREGLRQAYLRIALESGGGPTCQQSTDSLIRFVRGTAALTDRRSVEEHLTSCGPCSTRIEELRQTEAMLWDRSSARKASVRGPVAGRRDVAARGEVVVRQPVLTTARTRIARRPGIGPGDYCVPA
jgi:RNA polymerase sigma factor (sigma-70 family)